MVSSNISKRTWLKGAGAALMASAVARPAVAQDKKLIPLRIGLQKISALTDAWVAKQEGIFEKNGLDVELIQVRSGNEAIAAQRGGHVDIIQSIPGTAMTANERGFELQLVAQNEVAHREGPDAGAVIVLNDSGLNSMADLGGKRIAVSNLHSQHHVSVEVVLRKHGVDPRKVTFLEIPFANHTDVLKAKQIDAAAALDPWTTQMRTSNFAKVLSWNYVESVPEQPIGSWFAKHDYVVKNRDPVDLFARSIRDAIEYMNADTERAKKNVSAYSGLDIAFLKDMPLNAWSYTIDPAVWQAVADMMHENGELQKPHKADEYLTDIVKPYLKKA